MLKSEPTTLINLTFKLRRDRAWLLQRIGRHIEMARDAGLEVCIGAEDASRADTDFLARIAEAAQNAGARRIRFADTLGLLDPFAVAERIGISCGEIPISKSKCMRTTISDWPHPTLWPQSVPGRHTLIRQREASVTFSCSASSLLPRGPGRRLLPDLRPTAPPGDGIQSICTSVRRDEPLETEAVRKRGRYARGEVAVDRIEALIADAASCALIYRSNNLPWD